MGVSLTDNRCHEADVTGPKMARWLIMMAALSNVELLSVTLRKRDTPGDILLKCGPAAAIPGAHI